MPLNNPLEIYKLLPKSNCRQCLVASCLAFATAVSKGQRFLNQCSHLESHIIEQFNGKIEKRMPLEQQQIRIMDQLKEKVASIDFSLSAERLGASFSGGKLTVKCLGKDFSVDPGGIITSGCHINLWIAIPILSYIVFCTGKSISGEWVPFRELKNGRTWSPLFGQRCEKPFKRIADADMDLFADILHIFGGRPAPDSLSSDISFILSPLPKVPLLISYCRPEEDLESKLNIFFDQTVEDNLNIEALYMLCTGIVLMFEKITSRHGKQSLLT